LGLCLSIIGKRAYFITENGISCSSYLSYNINLSEGDVCSLSIDVSNDKNYFPVATIMSIEHKKLYRNVLLSNQLQLLHNYNQKHHIINKENSSKVYLPYIHLIVDNYFHIYEDKIVRYNLYHIARLISLIEKSTLSNYYASCLQYMEMMECFESNLPVEYSIRDFEWNETFRTQFPSLKNHIDMYNLLKNFGAENDIEYLYSLAINPDLSDRANKFARLSLASALIESVSDNEDIVNQIRKIAAAEIGQESSQELLPTVEENNEDYTEVIVF